jgi:phage-related protein
MSVKKIGKFVTGESVGIAIRGLPSTGVLRCFFIWVVYVGAIMKVIIVDKVEDFLDSLDAETRASSRRLIEMLREFGSMLRMPYSKNIMPEIFELRVIGQQNVRLIFTYLYNDTAIIFHAFIKKTEQIRLKEIKLIRTKFNNLPL